MNVKEAASQAKQYLTDLLMEEGISNVGLEEIEFDDRLGNWKVTVGFSRPWDHRGPLAAALVDSKSDRSYKVVLISDSDGRVISLTDRFLSAKSA